jgi:uncharacterized membrane protein
VRYATINHTGSEMNFAMPGTYGLFFLLPLLYILLLVYFVLRFLHAMERGVAAHERIADELGRLSTGSLRDSTGGGGT